MAARARTVSRDRARTRIERARNRQGLSYARAAHRIANVLGYDVSYSTVRRIELDAGETGDVLVLAAAAEVYGVKLRDLVSEERLEEVERLRDLLIRTSACSSLTAGQSHHCYGLRELDLAAAG